MESTELARLRRVAGKQTTRLTHYGRKTGKPYEVTIWFVLDGDKLYIGTANVNRQWVRNVQKTPRINLSMGDESFSGTVRFLTDRAEHERVMTAGVYTCNSSVTSEIEISINRHPSLCLTRYLLSQSTGSNSSSTRKLARQLSGLPGGLLNCPYHTL
jgi:deazaflavin-dependent oxidoreductase (nitroreductase family)